MSAGDPPTVTPDERDGQLLGLLRRMEALKHLARAGWVDREVAAPETVAAHSWRLALMAWLCAEAEGLDAARAMRLALVHDLPEAITGDSTPFDDQADTPAGRRALAANPPDRALWRSDARRATKIARERAALAALLDDAPSASAHALRAAWEDYEAGSSAEARLVGQLDKLEAYLQGCEYARSGRLPEPRTLASFQLDLEQVLTIPAVRALFAAVRTWNEEGQPPEAAS